MHKTRRIRIAFIPTGGLFFPPSLTPSLKWMRKKYTCKSVLKLLMECIKELEHEGWIVI